MALFNSNLGLILGGLLIGFLIMFIGRHLKFLIIGGIIIALMLTNGYVAIIHNLTNPSQMIHYVLHDAPQNLSNVFNPGNLKWGQNQVTHLFGTAKHDSTVMQAKLNNPTQNNVNQPPVSTTIKQKLQQFTDQTATNLSPNNTGNNYWSNNSAQLQNDNNVKVGQAIFSTDATGRSGIVMAKLTQTTHQLTTKLNAIDHQDVHGWPASDPKVKRYHNITKRTVDQWLYQPMSMLSVSAAGAIGQASTANYTIATKEALTGQNGHGGLQVVNDLLTQYWRHHQTDRAVVHYQAQPVYFGDEVIPRGWIINVQSNDDQLDQQLVVINTTPGLKLNYHDGTFTSLKN